MKRRDEYELTNPQKRIWIIEEMYPGTSISCIGGIVSMNGAVNMQHLEQSIKYCILQHDALRIQLVRGDGDYPKQYISEHGIEKLDYCDFSKKEDPQSALRAWAESEFKTPFHLVDSALYYIALFSISDVEKGFLLKFHHIIIDGWSISLMTSRIYKTYQEIYGNADPGFDSSPRYTNFIFNEQQYIQSELFTKNKNFWVNKFSTLSGDLPTNNIYNVQGKRSTFVIDNGRSFKIKRYLKQKGISLNTYFTAIFLIYHYKVTNSDDVTIGIPISNRCNKIDKNTIGMYTSSMPLRVNISGSYSFFEFAIQVNKELRSCFANQRYPYNLLRQDIKLREQGYSNLFDICINYYNSRHATQLGDIIIENEELYNGYQIYSLQLVIKEWLDDDLIQLLFDYNSVTYTESKIRELYNCLIWLTDQIIESDSTLLKDLSLISGSHIKLNCRHHFLFKSIVELFDIEVEKHPQNVAISHAESQLSYSQLSNKIDQLAFHLLNRNVTTGVNICIVAEPSIEAVIGILAILKCGACFVPIDPKSPRSRIKHMIDETGSGIILKNIDFDLADLNCGVIDVRDPVIFGKDPKPIIFPVILSDHNAYIIYTSGSTGSPKGVVVQHSNLSNYICWAAKKYIQNGDDIFAFYSSIGFDLTITSMFAPLICGAQIRVYLGNEYEHALYRIMDEAKATIIKITPSHLAVLSERNYPHSSIDTIIVGGEDLKVVLAQKIFSCLNKVIRVYNEYGPTETTVGCMIHEFDRRNDSGISVPIGKPIDNTRIYILNSELHKLPLEHSGEIYVSGSSISRGYLKKDALTAGRFIPDPFDKGKIMYKTGDFARYINSETIVFEGRKDSQVKLRGYRIELNEIEFQLLSHKDIRNAKVMLSRTGINDAELICAYLVTTEMLTREKVVDYLKTCLPSYMIPARFIFLDEIPLTKNGKVDIEMLAENDHSDLIQVDAGAVKTEFQKKALSEMEAVLMKSDISLSDNFYFIGGDSIKAIQLASKFNAAGMKIAIQDILANPIIYEMIAKIRELEVGAIIDSSPIEGYIESMPIIDWFTDNILRNKASYTQSVLLELETDIAVDTLSGVFSIIIKCHDTIRVNYDAEKHQLFYNSQHLNAVFPIEEHDLTNNSEDECKRKIVEIGERYKISFRIESDILLKACIFKINRNRKMLFIVAHHLIIDGVSWRILLDDLALLLTKRVAGLPLLLPKASQSLKRWVSQLKREYYYLPSNDEVCFWNDMNENARQYTAQFGIADNRRAKGVGVIMEMIEKEETGILLNEANKYYNTTSKEILLITLILALNKFKNENKIVIETESHGRNVTFTENIEVDRSMGWFTRFDLISIDIFGTQLNEQIRSIKEQIRNPIYYNYRFSILRDLYKMVGKHDCVLRFNYLGDFDNVISNEHFRFSDIETGLNDPDSGSLDCLVSINCYVINQVIYVRAYYPSGPENYSVVRTIIHGIKGTVRKVISFLSDKIQIEHTPSDFEMVRISQSELDSLFD